jgi:hypothetical protein
MTRTPTHQRRPGGSSVFAVENGETNRSCAQAIGSAPRSVPAGLSRTTSRKGGTTRSGGPVRVPWLRCSRSETATRPISSLSGETVVSEGVANRPSSVARERDAGASAAHVQPSLHTTGTRKSQDGAGLRNRVVRVRCRIHWLSSRRLPPRFRWRSTRLKPTVAGHLSHALLAVGLRP